jgi:hypothetical protein
MAKSNVIPAKKIAPTFAAALSHDKLHEAVCDMSILFGAIQEHLEHLDDSEFSRLVVLSLAEKGERLSTELRMKLTRGLCWLRLLLHG